MVITNVYDAANTADVAKKTQEMQRDQKTAQQLTDYLSSRNYSRAQAMSIIENWSKKGVNSSVQNMLYAFVDSKYGKATTVDFSGVQAQESKLEVIADKAPEVRKQIPLVHEAIKNGSVSGKYDPTSDAMPEAKVNGTGKNYLSVTPKVNTQSYANPGLVKRLHTLQGKQDVVQSGDLEQKLAQNKVKVTYSSNGLGFTSNIVEYKKSDLIFMNDSGATLGYTKANGDSVDLLMKNKAYDVNRLVKNKNFVKSAVKSGNPLIAVSLYDLFKSSMDSYKQHGNLVQLADSYVQDLKRFQKFDSKGFDSYVSKHKSLAAMLSKVGDKELKFEMNTVDKTEIINEIALKTGLSVDEINQIAKFEVKTESENKETQDNEEKKDSEDNADEVESN